MKIYSHILLENHFREQITSQLPGFDIYFRSENGNVAEDRKHFESADYIIGNPPVGWFEKPLDSLKFLHLDTAGFDQYKSINLKARVANIGDWFAHTCAETMVGAIICLYRGIDKFILLRAENQWQGARLRDKLRHLKGENVMILGDGGIGSRIRRMLECFECKVTSFAKTSPNAEIHDRTVLLEELKNFDIVINTLPGLGSYFVEEEFLSAMKKGSLYVNVGRGSTTHEGHLVEALTSGHLGGAILDVTEIEPLPQESLLWNLPNVILTQHSAGGRANEDGGKVELFIENIKNIESGSPVKNEVDIRRGY
jgi:phosphoglycerate dehydrogenase-like enzyme